MPVESWSTQQLAEFLALVSSFTDEDSAINGAVERAAEALDAEVAAVLRDGSVAASIGYPAHELPVGAIVPLGAGSPSEAHLPGIGSCRVLAMPIDFDDGAGQFIVARAGEEDFDSGDRDLLRGMARVLSLTLRMLQRQQLLERLSTLQRMIVRREEPHEVLDAVVRGASEMIREDFVGLRLIDPLKPDRTVLVSSVGLSDEHLAVLHRGYVGQGAGGRAISEDRLVIIDDYSHSTDAIPLLAANDLVVAMAAPVREKARVVGSLVVASWQPGRIYSPVTQAMLLAFAEHASLALTDAKMVTEALHHAFHDSLTDLPNRALFVDRLEDALRRHRHGGEEPAVLFLDLDRFKIVNDSLGHGAGDDLLIQVGARIIGALRPTDTVARFGGDEFAILLEDVGGREAAEQAAAGILRTLRTPLSIAGRDISVSASIGITLGGHAADDVIRDADMAMYRAKAQGKARYAVFEPYMRIAVMERAELEADLQLVVERNQLKLNYQPIVTLSDGGIIGVEALCRWHHPTRGLVPPTAFIPLAEELQLMPELGRWILGEACRQAARWHKQRPLELAVNLSACQLQSPGIADDVAVALRESGLPPSSLVLEITETALMEDVPGAIACLRALKNLGVRLAIDDFGTGYSSLHYLRRFPIDILKIDKAFVDDLANGDSTLANAIIDLGESFELQVVAEGIETEEQRALLRGLGCRLGQGYYFGHPEPADEIEPQLLGGVAWPARVKQRV